MGLDFEIPSRASSAKVFISFQFAPFNPWLWFSREEACEEQSENFVNKKSCCFSREHFFFFFFSQHHGLCQTPFSFLGAGECVGSGLCVGTVKMTPPSPF